MSCDALLLIAPTWSSASVRCFSESLLGVGDLSPPPAPPPGPARVEEDGPPGPFPSTVLGDGDLRGRKIYYAHCVMENFLFCTEVIRGWALPNHHHRQSWSWPWTSRTKGSCHSADFAASSLHLPRQRSSEPTCHRRRGWQIHLMGRPCI